MRYHASCELAGRRFDDVTVDVALGDRPIRQPEVVRGPGLLTFADIEPAEVPVIPLTQHVAEKLHAYTRTYGRAGISSIRVKDLIDLVLIRTRARLDAGELRLALDHTFASRGRRELPARFPPAPPEWRVSYRRMAGEVGVPPDLGEGRAAAAALLDPILSGEVSAGDWDPESGAWRSPPA